MATRLVWYAAAFFFLINFSQGYHKIVEKGQSTVLQCSITTSATSITWQLNQGATTTNLSTCSFVDTKCSDQQPFLYQGFISGSGNDKQLGLNVTKAKVDQTQFVCIASNGDKSDLLELEVYAWPYDSECEQNLTDSYVDYTCTIKNVYPNVTTSFHRMDIDFKKDDFDNNHTYCQYSAYGNGSEGDYFIFCNWRVPLDKLPLNNTVNISLTASVSNMSVISNKPIQQELNLYLSVPTVELSPPFCPDNLLTIRDSILIGELNGCSCQVTSPGNPPGFAKWFRNDVVQPTGNVQPPYVELLFSYNSTDPEPLYECRPTTPLKAKVISAFYKPKFAESYTFAESLEPTSLQCSFPKEVKSVTWQLLYPNRSDLHRFVDDDIYNLTTCDLAGNKCSKESSELYEGSVLSGNVVELNISSVKLNKTQFRCLADNGLKSNVTQLAVYVWPKKPVCTQNATNTYIDYTCTTDGQLPNLVASLHRRGDDFNIYYSESNCKTNHSKKNADGSSPAICFWRVPIDPDYMEVKVYARMSVEMTLVIKVEGRQDAESEDVVTTFSYPNVSVDGTNCPVGKGVKNNVIKVGTSATCRCEVISAGYPTGNAMWMKSDNRSADQKINEDGSSTLNIETSGANVSYKCVGKSMMKGYGAPVQFTPTFQTGASQSLFNPLHLLVVIFGVICSKFAL